MDTNETLLVEMSSVITHLILRSLASLLIFSAPLQGNSAYLANRFVVGRFSQQTGLPQFIGIAGSHWKTC